VLPKPSPPPPPNELPGRGPPPKPPLIGAVTVRCPPKPPPGAAVDDEKPDAKPPPIVGPLAVVVLEVVVPKLKPAVLYDLREHNNNNKTHKTRVILVFNIELKRKYKSKNHY
jgi:hypothetical protein